MKKLFALFLSVVMCFSTMAPALAIEEIVPVEVQDEIMLIDEDMGYEEISEEEMQASIDANKVAMGGVLGQLGVMVNGVYLEFPADKIPYAVNGVTHVDAAVLGAALKTTLVGDANGCVAVRVAGEAAGYTVSWDSDYETVVLINYDDLAAQLNEKTTILTSFIMNYKNDAGKNYKGGVTVRGNVTMLDSINGDQKGKFTMDSKMVMSDDGVESNVSYDLTGLLPLVGTVMGLSPELEEMMNPILKSNMDIRFDTANKTSYMRGPLIDLTLSGRVNEGTTMAPNTWVSSTTDGTLALADEMTSVELADMDMLKDFSLGSVLMGVMSLTDNESFDAERYDNAQRMVDRVVALIGNDMFVKSGTTYTYTLDWDSILTAVTGETVTKEDAAEHMGMSLKQPLLTMTIKDGGMINGKIYADHMEGPLPTMVLNAAFDLTEANQKFTADVHLKNVFKGDITIQRQSNSTSQKPLVAPAAGETVLNITDMIGSAAPEMADIQE